MKKVFDISKNRESSEKQLLFIIMTLIIIVLLYWEIVVVRSLYLNYLSGFTSLFWTILLWVIANTTILSIQANLTYRLFREIRSDRLKRQ
ncbi:hypothetical protein I592_04188 [Enterococcus gilvus ATCC BAA-350]|uniref:Uncharacterized protein n=1 Tax=Enterococcus gilvus ATCC BAA-350 TaxID=1158614 RepID=R2XNC9_9ENTE|nr:hypothetical protein UKC_04152 [Enterococcus gilvus ATCC BAA-350]EOW77212.1 hypothetical protein I592_04188 [Enterococcus gilvus ATCC BAA-350]